MTPNRDWLESDERIYPVTIDPSLTTAVKTGIFDTQISSSSPNTNYASINHISIGKSQVAGSFWSAYLKCDELPTFAHGEMVTSSKLRLKNYTSDAYENSPNNKLCVKKVTGIGITTL